MQRQGPAGFLKKKFKNKLTDNKLKRTEIVLTLYGSHTSLFYSGTPLGVISRWRYMFWFV
jgi:hypothetical protein